MTGMTPERVAKLRRVVEDRYYFTNEESLDLLDHIDHLTAEVDRLRAVEAAVRALTENYRNHYEMHGAAGDDYVVEDGQCVDVDDLLALLNPTKGETDADT